MGDDGLLVSFNHALYPDNSLEDSLISPYIEDDLGNLVESPSFITAVSVGQDQIYLKVYTEDSS